MKHRFVEDGWPQILVAIPEQRPDEALGDFLIRVGRQVARTAEMLYQAASEQGAEDDYVLAVVLDEPDGHPEGTDLRVAVESTRARGLVPIILRYGSRSYLLHAMAGHEADLDPDAVASLQAPPVADRPFRLVLIFGVGGLFVLDRPAP